MALSKIQGAQIETPVDISAVNLTGVTTAAQLNVGTGGTIIHTTDAGLVGIGTTNPQTAKLCILAPSSPLTNAIQILDDNSAGDFSVFSILPGSFSGGTNEIRAINSTSLRLGAYGSDVTPVQISLAIDDTDRITILRDGRTGIGTTNPNTSSLVTIGSSQSLSNSLLYLDRDPTGGYWSGLVLAAQGQDRNSLFADSDFSFRFRTKTGAGSTDRMMINSNGKVGINTDTFGGGDRLFNVAIDDSTAYAGLTDFQQTYHALRLKNVQDDKCVGMEFQVGSNGDSAITATELNDGNMQLSFGLRNSGNRVDRYKFNVERFEMNSALSAGPWLCGDPDLVFTLADDATVTFGTSITGAALVAVYNTQSGYGGLFGVNYGGAAALIYNGGQVAASDTDGFICVYKSAGSHGWTLKNRLGLSRNFVVGIYATHMQ